MTAFLHLPVHGCKKCDGDSHDSLSPPMKTAGHLKASKSELLAFVLREVGYGWRLQFGGGYLQLKRSHPREIPDQRTVFFFENSDCGNLSGRGI